MTDHIIQARFLWVKTYLKTKDAGLTCLKCGISRPTLRMWVRRYEQLGLSGLRSTSSAPHSSPNIRVNDQTLELILALRIKRNLGCRRLRSEMIRLYGISLSTSTIHKYLVRSKQKPIRRIKREKRYLRYEKQQPGEQVQIDVCKIRPGFYQYTAIDDCTRYRVLRLYSRQTAKNTIEFIDEVVEEMYFPIQRIQTDRGREFFAYQVQERLMDLKIKFRPIKPASPHLNGKVERSQQTDLQEFYPTLSLEQLNLIQANEELAVWQHYYNWERPHGALNGKSPMDKVLDLIGKTPFWDDVYDAYESGSERIREQNYNLDLRIGKLKGGL